MDEVGEGNLLGVAGRAEGARRRTNGNDVGSVTSQVNRPPKRKSGPLDRNAVSQWRFSLIVSLFIIRAPLLCFSFIGLFSLYLFSNM